MERILRINCKLKMMCIIFVLMVTMGCVVHGQCDRLKVFIGGSEVNVSSICIKKYSKADCTNFANSFNQSDLPEGYPVNEPSVEKPTDLELGGLESNHSDGYVYPGFYVQWKSPFSGISRINCYGYLIVWDIQSPDSNSSSCLLFHTQTGNTSEITYRYDSPFVTASAAITFRVYSMPPVKPEDKNDERSFVASQMQTIRKYKVGEPGEWNPSVTYKIFKNGTISISFSLPPADFNLTNFTVHLMDKNSIDVSTTNFKTELRTSERTQYFMTLSARESGLYSIWVWVNDEFRYVKDKCQCWIWQNDEKTCKSICGGTSTSYFYLNITEPPLSTTTVQTTTSAVINTTHQLSTTTSEFTTTQTNMPTPGTGDKEYLPLIIGGVVAFLLISSVITCCLLFKNKEKVKKFICGCSQDFCDNPTGSGSSPGAVPAVIPLTKKTLYIMSADDHEAHIQLVDSFVEFLKVHCYCNVIRSSDRNEHDTGSFEWFQYSVKKSDYLIFIDSVAAKNLTDAYLKKETFKKWIVGPEDDLFRFGLKHILFSEEVREKSVVLVSFHRIQCQGDLQIPVSYILPKHLPQFLQKIHKLDATGVRTYNSFLPLKVENIPNLPEGAAMQSACEKVKIFERNNSDWFEKKFGEAVLKPGIERLVSEDSGFREFDSVSQYDHHGKFVAYTNTSGDMYVSDHNQTGLDEISILTVEVTKLISQPLADEFSVVAPDRISKITYNTTAFHEINENKVAPQRLTEKLLPQSKEVFDNLSFIPPETASEITFSNYSTAISNINYSNTEFLQNSQPISNSQITDNYQDFEAVEADEDLQNIIIPPVSPRDIQEDSVSSAFADINANSYKMHEAFILFDNENIYLQPDSDSVSI